MFLRCDLTSVEPQAHLADIRAGKPFGEINQQFNLARRELYRGNELGPQDVTLIFGREGKRETVAEATPDGGVE
jgi:hypothetical protein